MNPPKTTDIKKPGNPFQDNRAVGFDQQVQSGTAAEFEGGVCGAGLADSGISECHSGGAPFVQVLPTELQRNRVNEAHSNDATAGCQSLNA